MRGEETFWGFSRFVPERGVFGELNGLLNHGGVLKIKDKYT